MYDELNKQRRAAVETGSLIRADFEESTKNPMREQERLLLDLLAENKDTEYGKKYGFGKIRSIRDYQERVPVTEYRDYEPYIERMADDGERNLLTSAPPVWYSKTSGTVGAPKRIPCTRKARDVFESYILDYQAGLLYRELGEKYFGGRSLNLSRCSDEVRIMPDGIPFGPLSESSRRKLYDRLKDKWMHFFAAPPQATFAGKDTDSRYLYALYSLRDENLMCLESTFSSFILDFCRFIEKNWDVLVRDIDAGTISEDVQIPDDVRKILTEDLTPMPERAAKLRKIFENGFDRPFMPLVWPDLLYISAAASGGFSRYTREIRSRYLGEKILFYYRGIVASEGIFSVPVSPADFSSCLIPDALFYEFLPVEEEDEEEPENKRISGANKAAPLTMDRLEPGRKYELIITDHSGFYRYRMKDVVLVTGTHNAAPMVEFQYRTDKTVSLMGEKTTEAALRSAEEKTAKECGFLLVDSSVYPDTEEIRYIFVMEIDRVPEDLTEQQILTCLEKNLAEANPSLGEKLDRGLINQSKILFAQPETYVLYREVMMAKGASVAQLKPVTVISNEFQKNYFFSLTDTFEEIRKISAL